VSASALPSSWVLKRQRLRGRLSESIGRFGVICIGNVRARWRTAGRRGTLACVRSAPKDAALAFRGESPEGHRVGALGCQLTQANEICLARPGAIELDRHGLL
jgi:hypothetical protein